MSLPGVSTVIKDRFYAVSRIDVPQGPKVLIIGRRTTADGTLDSQGNAIYSLDVHNVQSEKELGLVFGPESDIVRGYLEAAAGGAPRISVIALPADTTFNHSLGTISSSSYTSGGGLDLWGDLWAAAETAQADIIVPWGRGSATTDWDDHATPATPGTVEFGFYADNHTDPTKSWARKVATEVARITEESHPCIAVMGVKPWVGQTDISGGMTPGSVSTHLGLVNLIDRNDATIATPDAVDDEHKMGTQGSYLSIVCAELKPAGYEDNYSWGWANGAATYAGYVSQLQVWSAPTMKRIFKVEALRYVPTRTQQLALIEKGLVPVSLNFRAEVQWVDATTFANDRSQYTRLTTVRIIHDAVQVVRSIAQNYVGEAATLELRNAFETAITSGLMSMQKQGALLAADFTISYFPRESKAIVDLILTPAFELRNIEIQVSVNL